MVNGAIAVEITNKKAIRWADPTCPFSKSIVIMIEIYGSEALS